MLLYLLERLLFSSWWPLCHWSGCHRVSTFFFYLGRPLMQCFQTSTTRSKREEEKTKRKQHFTLIECASNGQKKKETPRRAKAGGPDVSRSQTSLINLQGCNNFIRECPATPSVAATNALRRIFAGRRKNGFPFDTHRWRCTRAHSNTNDEIYRRRVCVTACRPEAKASDDNTRY